MTPEEADAKVKAWHLLCGDIDYNIAQMAMVKLLKTAKFEPKPSELIEAAESFIKKETLSAEEAWIEVGRKLNPYQKPQWSNEIIKLTVDSLGYINLCNSLRPEIDRERFIKTYNIFIAREKGNKTNNEVMQLFGETVKSIAGKLEMEGK